jgi:hypothetical protein
MARKKQKTRKSTAHPPTDASKATQSIKRRDMRRRDPFAITAQVDPSYPRDQRSAYVHPTSTDLYRTFVPEWQEEPS